MAHDRQREYCQRIKWIFPEYFKEVNVCDIGSLDLNGNNHYLFEDYSYIGVDIGRGPNVNVVSKGHEYRPIDDKKYDTVISTEVFEHDMYWKDTIQNVIDNLLRPGGLFVFSCATTGRPVHGTSMYDPQDSPFTVQEDDWAAYYMNVTELDVRAAIKIEDYFTAHHFYVDTESCDLYFWGILK
jgi:SAM-dependent methyltransferase